jgi:superfamily I DNA/RNA helicase
LFDRKEVRDGMAFMQLLHNTNDEVALRRIINVPPRGIGPQSLDRLAAHAKAHGITLGAALHQAGVVQGLPAGAVVGAQKLVQELTSTRAAMASGRPGVVSEAVGALFDRLQLKDAILSANDSPSVCTRRLENLAAAQGALGRYEKKHGDEGQVLQQFLRATALRHEQPEEDNSSSSTCSWWAWRKNFCRTGAASKRRAPRRPTLWPRNGACATWA